MKRRAIDPGTAKGKTSIGFLLATGAVLLWEVVAAYDGQWAPWNPSDTQPWTHIIVENVPEQATFAVLVALALWVFPHFDHAYRRRSARTGVLESRKGTAMPTVSDLIVSLIRTLVATAIGTALTYLASRWNIVLDATTASGVIMAVTATFVAGYYTVIRILEQRWSWFGWFLGLAKPPKYPATPPVVSDPS